MQSEQWIRKQNQKGHIKSEQWDRKQNQKKRYQIRTMKLKMKPKSKAMYEAQTLTERAKKCKEMKAKKAPTQDEINEMVA